MEAPSYVPPISRSDPSFLPSGLSKWVRSKMRFFDAFQSAQTSLAQFTKERLEIAGSNPNTRWVCVLDIVGNCPPRLWLIFHLKPMQKVSRAIPPCAQNYDLKKVYTLINFVMSPNCSSFIKSYNFVFKKMSMENGPHHLLPKPSGF